MIKYYLVYSKCSVKQNIKSFLFDIKIISIQYKNYFHWI